MASVLISGTHPLPHLDKMGEYDAGDRDDDDDDGDGDGDGDGDDDDGDDDGDGDDNKRQSIYAQPLTR